MSNIIKFPRIPEVGTKPWLAAMKKALKIKTFNVRVSKRCENMSNTGYIIHDQRLNAAKQFLLELV